MKSLLDSPKLRIEGRDRVPPVTFGCAFTVRVHDLMSPFVQKSVYGLTNRHRSREPDHGRLAALRRVIGAEAVGVGFGHCAYPQSDRPRSRKLYLKPSLNFAQSLAVTGHVLNKCYLTASKI